jgi:hypothetical protein
MRVTTSDDHVDIEECLPTRRSVNKEGGIMITGLKTSINDNRGKVLKPGTRSLLEAVKRAMQPANHTIRDRVPWRWLHVDLTQLTIKKGILDIKLENGPLSNRSNNKKSPNSGHVGNRGKSLIIVTTVLLLKTTRHKTILVALKRAIRSSLDLIDPLASNGSHVRRQGHKIPSTGALQSGNLLIHGMLSVRMGSSLSVGGRLNKSSRSETIALRRS